MCTLCGKLPEECVYVPSTSYSSLDELISNHPVGFPGQTYLVNEEVYVWLDGPKTWINVGLPVEKPL